MPPKGLNATSKSDDEDGPVAVPGRARGAGKRPVNAPHDIRNFIGRPSPKRVPGEGPPSSRPVKRVRTDTDAASQKATVQDVPEAAPARVSPPPLSGGVIEEIATNPPNPSRVAKSSAPGTQDEPMSVDDSEDEQPRASSHRRPQTGLPASGDEADDDEPARPKTKGKSKAIPDRTDPRAIGDDGLLADLDHIRPAFKTSSRDDKTKDIRAHFSEPREIAGETGNFRDCNFCKRDRKPKFWITDSHTSLRRHLESYHKAPYDKWCKENGFESKLPKARKAQAQGKSAGVAQDTLDDHLQPMPEAYSEETFRAAILEWLAATDQPLDAVDHPTFRRVINLASRAKHGVKIPSRKATRKELVNMLNQYFLDLAKRLERAKGKVSATCDCWSADNMDSYFGVTAHWVEDDERGQWQVQAALVGFVNIRHKHNGHRLGQALFKVFERVKICDKIGWITCDNASNNSTMMTELESQVQLDGDDSFDARQRRIRCLSHIINLATQALLKARSEASNRGSDVRDEAGLVRNAALKERSSTTRITRFHKIQGDRGVKNPRNLLRDMPIRWSSTKIMLDRAIEHRADIKQFVLELEREETSAEKRDALGLLHISAIEWVNVNKLLELLSLADDAQIAFSAEKYPTLFDAVPALTLLLHAWEKRRNDVEFKEFHLALDVAIAKLEEYRNIVQNSPSDAYWVAMVLHPEYKFGDEFAAFWGTRTPQLKVKMEKKFKERFELLDKGKSDNSAPAVKKAGLSRLRADAGNAGSPGASSAAEPWRAEYDRFINIRYDVPEDMSLVTWWGLYAKQLPTWASLAADYLAIMSSSVSSERAFSSAGITITKRRNRLKGDIVEALQVLKCGIRNDLLVREAPPSSVVEQDFVVENSCDEEDGDARVADEFIIDMSDSDSEDEFDC